MRLITWNVAGRTRRTEEQVQALLRYRPDVVALQEIHRSGVAALNHYLARAGLPHSVDVFATASPRRTPAHPRRTGALIASRWPLATRVPRRFLIPWPERVLSCVVECPTGPFELHTTHVPPGSSNGWIKIETLEGIYRRLARPCSRPRILCGDFNTPQAETADGTVMTFGQDLRPDGTIRTCRTIRGRDGSRWDRAERSILVGLRRFDLVDVFRELHPRRSDFSHVNHGVQLRFDHIFASARLNPVASRYLHVLRERGLSDHSPLLACFAPS